MKTRNPEGRKLRAGIVGGGRGAFIGSVHRIAAELDGQATVVVGAMSADPENARLSAAAWFLERSYADFEEMAASEASRVDGIDFVIVATPNHLHVPVATAFLNHGIHVICDKPLGISLAEAESFAAVVDQSGCLFGLTHNYTGYPAVRQARAMIRAGKLGALRKVLVEYNQDWLMDSLEATGQKQAAWRTDPARAGISGCVADIGTHAENLLEYITGDPIESLCADLSRFVSGRMLDDDANVLLRLRGGGKGTLVCSQIACGEENALSIRLYGERGGLEWRQQEPNSLLFKPAGGGPWESLRCGRHFTAPEAQAATRIPAGHPEGYLEAFAVIYRDFVADVRRVLQGNPALHEYPSVHDGLRGMRFIHGCVESSRRGGGWVTL